MKKYSILLLGLLFFSACRDQSAMLILGATRTLISPSSYLGSGSESKYQALLKETPSADSLKQDTTDSESSFAISNPACITEKPDNQSLSDLNDKIREQACTCKAWGTCEKNVCQCISLCPKGMAIFRDASTRDPRASYDPTLNAFAFSNADTGKGVTNYGGMCWGHANLNEKFNRLAFFNPDLPMKFPNDPKKRVKFYKEIVDRIAKNEPVEIPGFKNTFEFSQNPEIQEHIIKKVGDLWTRFAPSFQGLKSLHAKKSLSVKATNDLLIDLKERLKNNQRPQLVFRINANRIHSKGGAHVALVTNIFKSGNTTTICLHDNNHKPKSNDCNCSILIVEGVATYMSPKGLEPLGGIFVAHNENPEVIEQQKNLTKKCAAEKNCPTEK